MKEVILKLLTDKDPGARKDGLEIMANTLAMAAKDEENAKQIVEGITAENIKEFISNYRKNADAEITKATKTAEENLRKKYRFVDINEEKKEPEDQTPDFKKLIEEAIAPYKTKLEQFEQGNIKAARRGKFDEAIKNAPESIRKLMAETFESRTFTDDAEFDKYIEDAKNKAVEFQKEYNSAGLRSLTPPNRANSNPDGVSAGMKAFVEKMNNSAKK